MAEVIAQCVGRKPSPNDKLIKNLCALTCADPSETPQATAENADNLLYENGTNQLGKVHNEEKTKNLTLNVAEERLKIEGAISRHGAELALEALSLKFREALFDKLPKLWDCITEALGRVRALAGHSEASKGSKVCTQQDSKAVDPQALINNLQVRSCNVHVLPWCDLLLSIRMTLK